VSECINFQTDGVCLGVNTWN